MMMQKLEGRPIDAGTEKLPFICSRALKTVTKAVNIPN